VSEQTTSLFQLHVCDAEPLCGTDTAQVTVEPPPINDVIRSVRALSLPGGTTNSLLKRLTGAQKNLAAHHTADACDQLSSFIAQVKALRNNKSPRRRRPPDRPGPGAERVGALRPTLGPKAARAETKGERPEASPPHPRLRSAPYDLVARIQWLRPSSRLARVPPDRRVVPVAPV
jgi:hypothetical protein